jgi:hypothetical protein
MTLGVPPQPTAGAIERRFESETREYVEEPTILGASMADIVGSDERESRRLSHGNEPTRDLLLSPLEVPMDLDIELPRPEHRAQPVETRENFWTLARSEHVLLAARCQGDEAFGVLCQVVPLEIASTFGGTKLASSDESTEIAVPAAVNDEQPQTVACDRYVCPDQRSQSRGAGCPERTWGAIDTVAIEKSHRVMLQPRSLRHEIFGKGSPRKEAERTSTA